MTTSICPVPKEQIPINEYQVLTNSIFFNWPCIGKAFFYKKLFYSWLILMPIITIICTGSHQLISSPGKLLLVSLVSSILLPFLLIIRHFLSWNYIYKRLRSEKIEYEESGWYDGQIWEKTLEMREKDILTAQHDIKPILYILKESLLFTILALLIGFILIDIYPSIYIYD